MGKTKCQGRRFWSENELDGWIDWAVFGPEIEDEEIEETWWSYGGSPGQLFRGRPCVWRTETRVLVTARCGWDV